MSEVKVNKISPRLNCGTTQLGDAGDTITVTGDLKSNSLKSASGSTITLGQSGDTIQLGCGATQTGFGRTGTVNWNTTAITADPANAVSGTGYFADTTSAAFTITLPTSPSAGDIVAISDYASNFGTNNLTVARNGSNIEGDASDYVLNQNGVSVTLIYVDGTKGWVVTNAGNSSQGFVSPYIIATGGTITTCGNDKIHTFTSPGSFTVCAIGSCAAANEVSYLVVAGGGGGGSGDVSGGGGAGGFREDKSPITPYTASPLDGAGPITVTATSYPITVGAGGAQGPYPNGNGVTGSNSVFSTITSKGGGGGSNGNNNSGADGLPGGSGGGAGYDSSNQGGGNVPPVSPPQGNPGGGTPPTGSPAFGAGGGGGAGAPGGDGTPTSAGNGGAGVTSSISGSPLAYSGGGGGARNDTGTVSTGGSGVGGSGGNAVTGAGCGTANRGGGGGGTDEQSQTGGAGGSGIVIIRYKYQ